MMSIDYIQSESRKAARIAARQHKRPYVVSAEELDNWKRNGLNFGFPFPFIGGYVPRGFKKTDNLYFVDSSGFGSEGESALTARGFIDKLRAGYAYAIAEAGQFQVYVQEYTAPAFSKGTFTGADLAEN